MLCTKVLSRDSTVERQFVVLYNSHRGTQYCVQENFQVVIVVYPCEGASRLEAFNDM